MQSVWFHISFQIKKTLNPQKYQIFLNTFLQYNNDSNYDAFLANLLDVFDEKQWHYILRGMIRFAKSTHKTAFERDVNNHILGQWIESIICSIIYFVSRI